MAVQVRKPAHEVSCYLTQAEARELRDEAAARHLSLSRYLRQCLLHYRALNAGADGGMRQLSIALSDIEARLARSIETQSKRITALHRELQVLFAMIDRLAFILSVHSPEVPDELRNAALAAGARLYNNWRSAVIEMTDTGATVDSFNHGEHSEEENQSEDSDEPSGDSIGAAR
jgi:Mobilization protein NikA